MKSANDDIIYHVRENGLYWLKYHGNYVVGYYDDESKTWFLTGNISYFRDDDFNFIGERIFRGKELLND